MDFTIPYGYPDLEDWILDFIYLHPKDGHSTQSLCEKLESALKAEPSHLEEYNLLMEKISAEKMSPEEYAAQRIPKLEKVQRAVESLIEDELVTGLRDIDEQRIVIFKEIVLMPKGERETIRRDRARVEAKKGPDHNQADKDKTTQKNDEKKTSESTDDEKQHV